MFTIDDTKSHWLGCIMMDMERFYFCPTYTEYFPSGKSLLPYMLAFFKIQSPKGRGISIDSYWEFLTEAIDARCVITMLMGDQHERGKRVNFKKSQLLHKICWGYSEVDKKVLLTCDDQEAISFRATGKRYYPKISHYNSFCKRL